MMPLTKEERQGWMDVLKNTATEHGALTFPAESYTYPKLCEKKILTMPAVDGFEFAVYFFEAKNRTPSCPIHINVHGGGFIRPHAENDSMYSAYIANAIKGIVLDVDYTTSDKAGWPVAFNQCYEVGKFAKAHCGEWNADAKRISMGGYSAGGTLTAGVALKAASTKDFNLCLHVIGYAPLDHNTHPLYKQDGYKRMMPWERELAFSALYFDGDDNCKLNPYSAPTYAPDEMLQPLPPALIITASGCNFRFEDEDYALRLARQGVEVTVKRFPGTNHGFIPHFMPGWKEAGKLIVNMINSISL